MKANPKRMKAATKGARKKVMKKRIPVIDNSSSSDSEVSLPHLEEELYIVLEVPPKNDQQLVHFAKVNRQVHNSIMSFSIYLLSFFNTFLNKIFVFFHVI